METRTQRPGTSADTGKRCLSTLFLSSTVAIVWNPSFSLTSETETVTWRAPPLVWLERAVSNSTAERTLFSASSTTIHCFVGWPVPLAQPTLALSSTMPAADQSTELYWLAKATTRAPPENEVRLSSARASAASHTRSNAAAHKVFMAMPPSLRLRIISLCAPRSPPPPSSRLSQRRRSGRYVLYARTEQALGHGPAPDRQGQEHEPGGDDGQAEGHVIVRPGEGAVGFRARAEVAHRHRPAHLEAHPLRELPSVESLHDAVGLGDEAVSHSPGPFAARLLITCAPARASGRPRA